MNSFNFLPATKDEIPILISVPHCGTSFAAEIIAEYEPHLIETPDDTDWHVDRLYDFAREAGVSMITAVYNRWVVDLNRDPSNKSLYSDGRIVTAVCPATTFLGELLYRDKRALVEKSEVDRRLELYYWHYHRRVEHELTRLKRKFGVALLWDCHSIRQFVPTVHSQKFPDLILGDADGQASGAALSSAAVQFLTSSSYSFSHNVPFKGGFITRHFGNPSSGTHALQLEMTKVNYMDDDEMKYSDSRAIKMQSILKDLLEILAEELVASTKKK